MPKCIDSRGCKNDRSCNVNLAGKFRDEERHKNFGECINSLKIKGFRGLECDINFRYPVTAITGMNGIGKTTVGQLMLCAYRKLPNSNSNRHYIYNYFPKSLADSNPFENNAEVEYTYQSSNNLKERSVTVSRGNNQWSGYKRQPEKAAILIGTAIYLPKHERADLTTYRPNDLEFARRIDISNGKMWATRILGSKYSDVFAQEFTTKDKTSKKVILGMAKRKKTIYSENNMGLGEARMIRMIRELESCPEKSLIVLDEPEIGLHVSAQRQFSKYLMCLSYRHGHQIVFSTHSPEMIKELPPDGRLVLERYQNKVISVDNVSSIDIDDALSDGEDGVLIVAVEDSFAKKFLEEIIYTRKQQLQRRIKIHCIGDANAVRNFVQCVAKTKVAVAGILDGDQKDEEKRREEENKNRADNVCILKTFPGDAVAPEKLIFESKPVRKMILKKYDFDFDRYLTSYPNADPHEYSYKINEKVKLGRDRIESECISEFVRSKSKNWGLEVIRYLESRMKY